jgi:hypothetical protein
VDGLTAPEKARHSRWWAFFSSVEVTLPGSVDQMRISRDLLRTVVFLGRTVEEKESFLGTGFLVTVPVGGATSTVVHLVTARHVVNAIGSEPFWTRFNLKNGGTDKVNGNVPESAPHWYYPRDDSVDVAVCPINVADADHLSVPVSMLIPRDQQDLIWLGDPVAVVGLFGKSPGVDRNAPIVRSGNVAMLPADPIQTRFGKSAAYLIEARSLGGLSGSPVFLLNSEAARTRLLGLTHGHWELTGHDINSYEPTDINAGPGVNMGVAIVVPAYFILDALNDPDLMEERAVAAKNAV